MNVKDQVLVIFAILMMIVGLLFMRAEYHDALDGVPNRAPLARILSHTNTVKMKEADDLAWKDIQGLQDLHNKEMVFTHEDSTAKISYVNESVIDMAPLSLIKIIKEDNDLELILERGLIGLSMTSGLSKIRLNVAGSTYELNSQGKSARLTITSHKEKKQIFLSEGKVELKGKSGKLNLAAGNYATMTSRQIEPVNTETLPIPILPIRGASLYQKPDDAIRFSWKYTGANRKFKLLLSRDSLFNQVSEYPVSASMETKISGLINGTYYWKIVALKGPEQFESPIETFDLIRLSIPEIIVPFDGMITRLIKGQEQQSTTLKWKIASGLQYEVCLWKNDSAPVCSSASSEGSQHSLSVGEYKWRVRAVIKEHKGDWSREARFTIEPAAWLKLSAPQEGGPLILGNVSAPITFSWQGAKRLNYSFLLERVNETERESIIAKDLSESELRWEHPRSGDFVWTVKAKGEEGLEQSSKIKIVLDIIHPRQNSEAVILKAPEEKVVLTWNYFWRPYFSSPPPLKFELSQDEHFAQLQYQQTVTEGPLKLDIKEEGNYFWRLVPEHDAQYFLLMDGVKLRLAYPPLLPPPHLPRRQYLHLVSSNQEAYRVKWPVVATARAYQLEIFADKELTRNLVTEQCKRNNFIFRVNATGVYYYRVQSIDPFGRMGPFSEVQKLISPISPLDE